MKRLALTICVLVLGAALPRARRAGNALAQECDNVCSGVTDVSYSNSFGNCDYNQYELEAQMDVSQTIYDEGEGDAWGVCYNYYDCDGSYT